MEGVDDESLHLGYGLTENLRCLARVTPGTEGTDVLLEGNGVIADWTDQGRAYHAVFENATISVDRKEPSSCPTKSGTRISDSSSMFWESRIRAFFASPFVSTGRTTTDSPKSPVPDGPWRTSAPHASSLSGAADNRWGGRDKRKDIHRKKERSWERNQPHTHAVRTAWTSTTRPT